MAGDLDLAIRVGWLRDSTLLARKAGGFRQLLVGAGANAEQCDHIQHPNDLAAASFNANKALSDPLQWLFENASGETVSIKLQSNLSIGSAPAIMAAVREVAGLAILPDHLVGDCLASGALTHVLPDWHLPEGGIFVVIPASKFRTAKVSAFAEMLRQADHAAAQSRDLHGSSSDMAPGDVGGGAALLLLPQKSRAGSPREIAADDRWVGGRMRRMLN